MAPSRNGSKRLLQLIEGLLGEIKVLSFEAPADVEYGAIRSELESAGKPIGANDLLIAAHRPRRRRHGRNSQRRANSHAFAALKVENWLT